MKAKGDHQNNRHSKRDAEKDGVLEEDNANHKRAAEFGVGRAEAVYL